VLAWVACWLVGTVVCAGEVVDVTGVSGEEPRYGAALVTVLLAVALARRCGGLVWFWGLLAIAFVALVLVADQRWLDSSAALFVAVVGAVASVMLTRPAATYVRLFMEYCIALLLAVSAAFAVAGYGAELSALVQEHCFYELEAPIQRVTGWDTPYPHAFEWEYFPGPKRVGEAMKRAMEG